MNKYIDFEYLKQNNPLPEGIQYKGLFGSRSIGKTHGVLKHLIKSRKEGTALMILRRNKLEMNFQAFVSKYSAAFGVEWKIDGHSIKEGREVIAYFSALSLAERCKHNNYDAPYVEHVLVDEVFAEKPNKNEFQQLETWITTLSRRTGNPFHPVTVWLLGNFDYGYSPILDSLGVFAFHGKKQKTSNGVYLFSDMESPTNVLNIRHPLIRPIDIKEGNLPVLDWVYKGAHFGLFDMGTHMYITNIEKAKQPYTHITRDNILKLCVRKPSLPRVYVGNYDCLRFVDHPALTLII